MIQNFVYNPQSQYLFKRAYALTVQTGANQTTALQYGTLGTTPAPLKVRFDVDKNSIGVGKATFDVYNLAPASRQNIRKGYFIQFKAGYNGLIQVLFTGVIGNIHVKRREANIVTTLECGDGESSIAFARLDKSYPAGTTMAAILQDVGTAMSTTTSYNPAGIGAGIALGLPNVVYNKGFVAHGACSDTLDKLLKPQGLKWNVQNGNLNIIPIKGYNGQTAIVVAANTGLIGVPSNNKGLLTFSSLLNPALIPGAAIQLTSTDNPSLNGYYTVQKSHFEGDTHDQNWQVNCEATAINQIVQTLSPAQGFNYSTGVSNAL